MWSWTSWDWAIKHDPGYAREFLKNLIYNPERDSQKSLAFPRPISRNSCMSPFQTCMLFWVAVKELRLIEGNLPHATVSPFRLCAVSTIVADHPCLLEFHCSASLYLLALVRFCLLESAGQLGHHRAPILIGGSTTGCSHS